MKSTVFCLLLVFRSIKLQEPQELASYKNLYLRSIQNGTQEIDENSSELMEKNPMFVHEVENVTQEDSRDSSLENITNWIDLSEDLCRTRDGRYLPPPLFAKDTCTFCYIFEMNKNRQMMSPLQEEMRVYTSNGKKYQIFVLVNRNDSTSRFSIDTSVSSSYEVVTNYRVRNNWKNCCISALRCCSVMRIEQKESLDNFCPRTWDGWQCWPDAHPNTENYELCPTYSYIHTVPSCQKSATKFCTEDGTWRTKRGREWTDYSSCGELQTIRLRLAFHVGALALSMLALIPALFIFYYYRQLRVYRITLHKQLFISLLFEASCSMAFRLLQLFELEIIEKSPAWCVALCLVQKYARQTNYMWYFCEGFYLHKLLAAAFAEQNNIIMFYVIGWGVPVILVGAYGILRALLFENSHCWTIPVDGLEYLIQLPPLFAMLMNFMFIVNILRILLMKARRQHDYEPSQFRMAVRACLMVIPLFGLQYIVTIYRPNVQACSWIDVYHITNNVIDGSTGLLVAIIFCYTNNEIQNLLKRSWKNTFLNYDGFFLKKSRQSKSRSFQTFQTTLPEDPKPISKKTEDVRPEQEYMFHN